MSKVHCFSNKIFENREALGYLRRQPSLSFDVSDLKLHDLTK